MSVPRISRAALVLLLTIRCTAQTASPNSSSTNNRDAISDSTQIEPTRAVKAIYPSDAVPQKLQGQVVIKVRISETGGVEKSEIISGDPVLARAAIEAANQWKFKPFIQNGKAIKIATRIPFDFVFNGGLTELTPTTTTAADGTKRALVSENAFKGFLIHKVQPEYPEIALSHHMEGSVVLHAIIGRDGRVKKLDPISGPKLLVRPAVEAVQQWRYKPFTLLGEPVEVDTKIFVNFQTAAK
jgi:TonB family protein